MGNFTMFVWFWCEPLLWNKDGETHTPPNDKGGGEIKETPEQLRVQLQTLMNSLATLSAEKSRMEASFQADKKHLRTDREEVIQVVFSSIFLWNCFYCVNILLLWVSNY